MSVWPADVAVPLRPIRRHDIAHVRPASLMSTRPEVSHVTRCTCAECKALDREAVPGVPGAVQLALPTG